MWQLIVIYLFSSLSSKKKNFIAPEILNQTSIVFKKYFKIFNLQKKLTASEEFTNKVQCSNNTKNFGLETKHEELQQKLTNATSQHSRLQIVCSLLCGALYPLYLRSHQLISERHLLEDIVDQGETTMEQLRLLIETLNEEMQSCGSRSFNDCDSGLILSRDKMKDLKMSPVMRFRKYTIMILAANRLCFLSRTSKRLFSTYDVALGPISLIVQTMIITSEPKAFAGNCLILLLLLIIYLVSQFVRRYIIHMELKKKENHSKDGAKRTRSIILTMSFPIIIF